jgi:hypothetical protein
MARVHGKDLTSLTLNSQALLTDTVSLGFQASAETHDTTTLGDDWREAIAGLKGGDEITHELFYDNTNTTGTYAFLTGLLGAAATTLSFGDGTRTTSGSVIVTKVSTPINVGDMIKVTASYKLTGAVTFS